MDASQRHNMLTKLQADGFTAEESEQITTEFEAAIKAGRVDQRPAMIRSPNNDIRIIEVTMAAIIGKMRPDLTVDVDGEKLLTSDEVTAYLLRLRAENN